MRRRRSGEAGGEHPPAVGLRAQGRRLRGVRGAAQGGVSRARARDRQLRRHLGLDLSGAFARRAPRCGAAARGDRGGVRSLSSVCSDRRKRNGPPTDGRNRKVVNMSSDGVTRVSVEIAGSEISFETGRMAKQASGAVVVRQGDTMVLATAVAGSLRDVDFLPLTVDVEERMYAAGKIPGSFFKREGS